MSGGKPIHLRLRDFSRWHSRPLRGWLKHRVLRRMVPLRPKDPVKLHVGCGSKKIEGWLNVDLQTLPEVDLALDATASFGAWRAELVFAEHFIEHLTVREAVFFLREMHRILLDGGRMRLSTPNLDWFLVSHSPGNLPDPRERSLAVNRGFYGWAHRFLWNRELLGDALDACGFTRVSWHDYGESELEALRGLERHETYDDEPDLRHVLIAEAVPGEWSRERYDAFCTRLDSEFLRYR